MEINKIHYTGSRMHIEYTKVNPVTETEDSFTLESSEQPAESFRIALDSLKKHVNYLCEFDESYTKDVAVRGVNIKHEKDDIASATISAMRKVTTTYSPFNIHAPSVQFKEREKAPSIHAIYDSICEVHNEAEMYINGVRAERNLFSDVEDAAKRNGTSESTSDEPESVGMFEEED